MKARIKIDPNNCKSYVEIDGEMVKNLHAFVLQAKAGYPTLLTLHLFPDKVEIEGEIEPTNLIVNQEKEQTDG